MIQGNKIIKPKSAEYDIGKDVYGRHVTLKYKGTSNNDDCWDIHIEPVNQRDETQRITGLSSENLLAISQVINKGTVVYRGAP